MAYKINKTDGSLLAEIIDSAIDQTATDLTLIGKNVTGYGEYINENFVKLLENFASSTEPNFPITGQLWYDLTENRLKIYDGNGFKVGNGPVVSSTQPTTLTQGDFWIDSLEKQLYFHDGINLYSAAKIWKNSQGKSGFEVRTIKDQFSNDKTVVLLWSANNLLGIFSHYPEFLPENSTGTVVFENATYIGSIVPGFNPSTSIQDFKFNVTATRADALINELGALKVAEDFMLRNEQNILEFNEGDGVPSLIIKSPYPLKLGAQDEASVFVDTTKFQIKTDVGAPAGSQDFIITIRPSTGSLVATPNAIMVKANTSRVGIFNDNPQAMLDVGGDVIIAGNLTVNGNTKTITANDILVKDKTITLAATATPTDALANGGGIELKGTTDKTLYWTQSTDSWTSNTNFNLTTGKVYKINGVDLLSQTNLLNVTDALDLERIGTLEYLDVDNIKLDNNVISVNGPTMILDLVTGGLDRIIQIGNTIDVTNGFARISNIAEPLANQDAATKRYVDTRVGNVVGTAWQEINVDYNASSADRLLVSTQTQQVVVALPVSPQIGDNIRFVDLDGTFNINNLVIARYRTIDPTSYVGTAAVGSVNVYLTVPTIAVTGTGTGFTANVNIQAEGTYTAITVAVVTNNPGVGYKSGDIIRIKGSDIGGADGTNDLIFELQMVNILGIDEDLVVDMEHSAIGLYFAGVGEGWKYTEKYPLPEDIYARFFGPLEGDVTGDLYGQVMIANQPNITTLGTLTTLEVQGTITGNLTGNTTGIHFGNVQVANQLVVESVTNNIRVRASNEGIILSTTNPTDLQEQYAIQVTGGNTASVPNTVNLFGNVIVDNLGPNSTNGASFRLPTYTTILRDARTSAGQSNNGEIIYNVDVHKVQVYANGTWVDLH